MIIEFHYMNVFIIIKNLNILQVKIKIIVIFVSPNVLILILNRGKGNIYDVKLDFSEIINITQYVLENDSSQFIS